MRPWVWEKVVSGVFNTKQSQLLAAKYYAPAVNYNSLDSAYGIRVGNLLFTARKSALISSAVKARL
jgi:hypothetical protein